jgi:1-acyl-sn-glycerol-3-phosphate acyltransferase
VAERLSAGDIIVLFAEGTSGDGNSVLPFRSALVGPRSGRSPMAELRRCSLSPSPIDGYKACLSAVCTGPLVAWYGGADLLPHLRAIDVRGRP